MTDRMTLDEVLTLLPRLVADARRGRHLSLRAAAEEIGVGLNTLHRVEHGHETSLTVAAKIVRWLSPNFAPSGTQQALDDPALRKQIAWRMHHYFCDYSSGACSGPTTRDYRLADMAISEVVRAAFGVTA